MTLNPLPPIQTISTFLAKAQLGFPQEHGRLTLWPLIGGTALEPTAPPYIPLADAVEAGTLLLDEVDEGGSVPHVAAKNLGDMAVLVLFGEELLGAKQNRIANASFLVPPNSQIVLDVSCVEAGRWARSSARFNASRSTVSSRMRRNVQRQVAESRRSGDQRFVSDQGEVWDDVAERLSSSNVQSATGSWADFAAAQQEDVVEAEAHFQCVPSQVGFVAALGGRVEGMEAIGAPNVFAQAFPTLLRGYLVDAVDSTVQDAVTGEQSEDGAGFASPEAFIETLAGAGANPGPSLGLGQDLRLAGQGIEGCALVTERVVHLTAFAE